MLSLAAIRAEKSVYQFSELCIKKVMVRFWKMHEGVSKARTVWKIRMPA